ncbi:hypothetical protein [Macrococcus equipercicus]|nr:hypothetical protein [Macrococcus equipercicus]
MMADGLLGLCEETTEPEALYPQMEQLLMKQMITIISKLGLSLKP